MRGAVMVSMLVCGCGRVNFDPQGDGGIATRDSMMPSSRVFLMTGDGGGVPSTVFTVDVTTGELVQFGTNIGTSFGEPDGLAYKDENHLWQTGYGNNLVEVTLSPLSARTVMAGLPSLTSLANDGGGLIAVDDLNNALVHLQPEPTMIIDSLPLMDGASAVNVDGGDITHAVGGGGFWLFWTNLPGRLYRVDGTTGAATLLATNAAAPYIVGITMQDTVLYGVARDTDLLYEIDQTNGEVRNPIPLCMPCPTPYDFTYGDLASGP